MEKVIAIVYDVEMLWYGNNMQMCNNVYGMIIISKTCVYICIRIWIMDDSE